MSDVGEITRLLRAADGGDAQAANDLYPLVEGELRKIASSRRRTLGQELDAQTTLLVDEAFVRLVGQQAKDWQPGDRLAFYSYAAVAIHHYLIDRLREQEAVKRQHRREARDDVADPAPDRFARLDFMEDLRTALQKLQAFARDEVMVFRMRTFLECTFAQVAEVMGISETKAKNLQRKAELLLERELRGYADEP